MEIVCADVIKWAEGYKGEKFHALLCDPPYELGFMGKDWDKSGIAFNPDTWAALAEHLHLGAFGMAFASSRGWHRLAVAIEDAGLRIHPSIFGWAYGSGFPKATRVDSQIDRNAPRLGMFRRFAHHFSEQREARDLSRNDIAQHFLSKTGGLTGCVWNWENAANVPTLEQWSILRPMLDLSLEFLPLIKRVEAERQIIGKSTPRSDTTWFATEGDETIPATPLAQQWQGHRYGLQALKPALEPIIVFQKPYPKGCKTWESIVETGAGALWIDGGRIGISQRDQQYIMERIGGFNRTQSIGGHGMYQGGEVMDRNASYDATQGRWPANFCLVHHPECSCPDEFIDVYTCVPECPVRKLGEQSGEKRTTRHMSYKRGGGEFVDGIPSQEEKRWWSQERGTAARFFHQSDWSYEIAERLADDSVMYCAKASRKERDAGLGKIDEFTPDTDDFKNLPAARSNSINTSSGKPRNVLPRRNPHPTVKPISLCRWLATLLLPPPAYSPRRLLVPFAGTGSEGIGAMQAGWEYILGIEMGAGICEIAVARIRYWQGIEKDKSNPATTRPDQLKMF